MGYKLRLYLENNSYVEFNEEYETESETLAAFERKSKLCFWDDDGEELEVVCGEPYEV